MSGNPGRPEVSFNLAGLPSGAEPPKSRGGFANSDGWVNPPMPASAAADAGEGRLFARLRHQLTEWLRYGNCFTR